jgi:hypothetical protein
MNVRLFALLVPHFLVVEMNVTRGRQILSCTSVSQGEDLLFSCYMLMFLMLLCELDHLQLSFTLNNCLTSLLVSLFCLIMWDLILLSCLPLLS